MTTPILIHPGLVQAAFPVVSPSNGKGLGGVLLDSGGGQAYQLAVSLNGIDWTDVALPYVLDYSGSFRLTRVGEAGPLSALIPVDELGPPPFFPITQPPGFHMLYPTDTVPLPVPAAGGDPITYKGLFHLDDPATELIVTTTATGTGIIGFNTAHHDGVAWQFGTFQTGAGPDRTQTITPVEAGWWALVVDIGAPTDGSPMTDATVTVEVNT